MLFGKLVDRNKMLWLFALLFVAFVCVRLFLVWPRSRRSKAGVVRQKRSVRTMIVLGSGGHTSELLPVAAALPKHVYTPRLYVVSESRSKEKAAALEQKNSDFEVFTIPRAREVGQSYFTSIVTTLYALVHSLWLVMAKRPELILCNGPGICIPIIFASLLLRFVWGQKASRVVFIESGCRVDKVIFVVRFGFLLFKKKRVQVVIVWFDFVSFAND